MRATRKSWRTAIPLPGRRARLRLERRFDAAEWSAIRQGLIPEAMEDKCQRDAPWPESGKGDEALRQWSFAGRAMLAHDGDGKRAEELEREIGGKGKAQAYSLGFDERSKGSHHIFRRAGIEERINLQRDGKHAKTYQVRQVRAVILRYRLGGDL